MYQEWMDGVPLLVSGCHEHNAEQLRTAANYYKKQGNDEMAEHCENAWLLEKQLAKEEKSLTFIGRIIKKISCR